MGNVVRWSEDQLTEHQKRTPGRAAATASAKTPVASPLAAIPATQILSVAKGAMRDEGMNKTEAEYAAMLAERHARKEIAWWKYEGLTLKLADATHYRPDFAVMLSNGEFEFHEVKGGFIREDGWLKLKIAAGQFPFRFFLCQKQAKKDGGKWQITEL